MIITKGIDSPRLEAALKILLICLRARKWLIPGLLCAFLLNLDTVIAFDLDRLKASFQRYGGSSVIFDDWRKVLDEVKNTNDTETRLRRINEFFNRRIAFAEDQQVWGKSDYWATPMETLAQGKGDCEDFTIAKYFTLREAGFTDGQMRLIYVKARLGGVNSTLQQAHMILAFYPAPDAEPLILDNLITEIRPASRRPDLIPVFSFNSQGIWQGAQGSGQAAGSTSRLSRWQDLLTRAGKEGFD